MLFSWESTLTHFIMFIPLTTTWGRSLSFSFLGDETESKRLCYSSKVTQLRMGELVFRHRSSDSLSPLYHVLLYLTFDVFISIAKSQCPHHLSMLCFLIWMTNLMSLAEKELLRKYLLVGYWFCFCFVFFLVIYLLWTLNFFYYIFIILVVEVPSVTVYSLPPH